MNSQVSQTEPPLKQLRQFGWMMGGVFGIISFWPLVFRSEGIRMWAGIIAAIFALLGIAFPRGLKPVYRAWMFFGEKIGWLNSRILLGLLFYGMLTPMAFVMALLGKRPLQLQLDPKAETYRVPKEARASDHVLKPF
jgi:hypothetical protein